MNTAIREKGASRKGQLTQLELDKLNHGIMESKTLVECLEVDFAELATSLRLFTSDDLISISESKNLGITKRMSAMGVLINSKLSLRDKSALQKHPSDSVRGWVAYAIGCDNNLNLEQKIDSLIPLIDDHHFGVREWSWLAVRADIASDITAAISVLEPLTYSDSPRIRRFASESIRPRGVWCKHIPELKKAPELAEVILNNLKSDQDKYVIDSVANWLNDCAKDNPTWVLNICNKWQGSETPISHRLLEKATRSIKI